MPTGEPPPPNPAQTKDNVVSTKPTTTGTSTAMSSNGPNAGSGDDDDTVIEFSSSNFDAEDDRVFHTWENAEPRLFSWTKRGQARLTKISLVQVIGDSGDESDYSKIFSRPISGTHTASEQNVAGIAIRDDRDSPFFIPIAGGEDAFRLDLEYFRSQASIFQGGEKVLAIKLDWARSGHAGQSYSGYFAVMYGDEAVAEANLQKKVKQFTNYETGIEDLLGEDDSVPAASTKSSDGTAKPTGTIGPGDHNKPGIGPGDPDKGGDSSSGVGNGLSKGAIAGIAVGSIVVAFLLGLLAWFLLRRRRKQRQQQRGASAHDVPNGYIVDKTADDTAIATTGAHSPYSDDGQGQSQLGLHHGQGDATAAAYPDTHQQYQHQQHDQRDIPRGDDGGAYTPSQHDSASRNYHHLVEEGMTAEDIRRLEEEERQLDAEIERAGRRGS
ncbi:hypothetical protein ACO1O0_001157 [Amphichorda felina]